MAGADTDTFLTRRAVLYSRHQAHERDIMDPDTEAGETGTAQPVTAGPSDQIQDEEQIPCTD